MHSCTHLHPQHEVSLPPLRLVNNPGTHSTGSRRGPQGRSERLHNFFPLIVCELRTSQSQPVAESPTSCQLQDSTSTARTSDMESGMSLGTQPLYNVLTLPELRKFMVCSFRCTQC